MATSTIKKISAEWKLQGTATGSTLVNLPSEYNELLLVGRADANNYWFSSIVPKNEVEETVRYARNGHVYNATNNASCSFKFSKSGAGLYLLTHNNGTDLTNNAVFKLYYR